MARVAIHCHKNRLVPDPADGLAWLGLFAGVVAALHNRDEAQLVQEGEELVLVADGAESRDYLAGPGVEQKQEQPGVVVQQLVVGWGRKVLYWDWRFGGDNVASSWDFIGLNLLLLGLYVLIRVVGHTSSLHYIVLLSS